jgi:hypothetical protein
MLTPHWMSLTPRASLLCGALMFAVGYRRRPVFNVPHLQCLFDQ